MRYRLLGASHVLVGVLLLPLTLAFGLITAPILLFIPVWLVVLGCLLWRGSEKGRALARRTHGPGLVFALLLGFYGVYALRAAARSADAGGGLLGAFGLIPLGYGVILGLLSLATLLLIRKTASR